MPVGGMGARQAGLGAARSVARTRPALRGRAGVANAPPFSYVRRAMEVPMKLWLIVFTAALVALGVNDALNYLMRFGWPS